MFQIAGKTTSVYMSLSSGVASSDPMPAFYGKKCMKASASPVQHFDSKRECQNANRPRPQEERKAKEEGRRTAQTLQCYEIQRSEV